MRSRIVLLPLLILLLGFLALLRLQWKHQLGGLAESPQEIEVRLGERVIVGGGRASLRFTALRDEEATFSLRCRGGRHAETLREGERIESACSILVELVTLWPAFEEEPESAWLEVTWDASSDGPKFEDSAE